MSEKYKKTENKPFRLTARGKVAATVMGGLSLVGAKDTGQGILNYMHTRNTAHYVPVDAHIGEDGGSLWQIARQAQPHGDIRPLVDTLIEEHGGTDIVKPHEHLVVENGHLVDPNQTAEQAQLIQ